MFNLFQCFQKYGLEHIVPWEAYKLENNLIVKILPESDIAYPLKVGQTFSFVSYDRYRSGPLGVFPLYIYNIDDTARDAFPLRITAIGADGEQSHATYSFNIIEKIPLPKVIDLDDSNYDFDLLNFTLSGIPLNSELLVFMMKEISRRQHR